MITADPKDFTVDLTTREVRHKSGASVIFHQQPSESDWLMTDSDCIQNSKLFEGSPRELLTVVGRLSVATQSPRLPLERRAQPG